MGILFFINTYFTTSTDLGETFSIIPFLFKLQCKQLLRPLPQVQKAMIKAAL